MGRVKGASIKRLTHILLSRAEWSADFEKNKALLAEVAAALNLKLTKSERNRLVGELTATAARLQAHATARTAGTTPKKPIGEV